MRHKIGVKTIHTNSNQTKPDKTGSRAANTAQLAALLIAWRTRHGLTRAAAARQLCCAPATLAKWERRRALPQGVSHAAIVAFLQGGAQ